MRIRLSVQRCWLCRGACVGRNNHQSKARRSGRRKADVTDHRSCRHALPPAAPQGSADLAALRPRPAAAALDRCHKSALRDGSAWRRGSLHLMDEGYKCANKSAAVRARVSAARGHTATQKAHHTPAVCAAVSPCGGVPVPSTPATVGGGGAGAPALGFSMYSQWGTLHTRLL